MSRRLQSYVLIREGRIVSKVALDPDELPTQHLPPGLTLMTEAAALVKGLTREGDDQDTTRAQQALALDYMAASRASDISDNASTLAGGSGSMTNAQLTAAVRILAGWIAVLARHDLLTQRQLMALILRDPTVFGSVAAPPAAVTITVTPAEATADAPTIS